MIATSNICPVCAYSGLASNVKRAKLPSMQNYIFRRIEAAQQAKSGQFDLALCPNCGFAHNISFDPTLLYYDEGYDNTVPSSVMIDYYKKIATYLYETYSLDQGLVVDVGCGKGTFLKIISEMFPAVRGLGIDPSYEGDDQISNGKIRFIKDFFSEKYIKEPPLVVICRHVLEHIAQPIPFLKSIRDALNTFPDTPLFVEVPDTTWIIQNGAFWDFCYEHCNYFTPYSLSVALKVAGFALPHTLQTAFGGQYIWIESKHSKGSFVLPDTVEEIAQSDIISKLAAYSDNELNLILGMRQELDRLKKAGYLIALWGMATKGIVFSFLIDSHKTLIDFCIDINPNKQGGFTPITGHPIEAPIALQRAEATPLMVIIMNPNYISEIRQTFRDLNLDPAFMDASGNRI